MRPVCIAIAIFGVLLWNPKVFAHDIGVTELGFLEQSQGRYQLVLESPPKQQEILTPPRLPAHCRYHQSPDNLVFDIDCIAPLVASDVIVLPWRTDALMVTATWQDGRKTRAVFLKKNEVIELQLGELAAQSTSLSQSAPRYLWLGIEHIALGIDHLLFVLGILLLVNQWGSLVKAITAFTLAHSLTLGLAFLDVISLRSAPVEAAIALSIVFLAYEVARSSGGYSGIGARKLWVVAGGFGLLHGLGFAGALADVGVPQIEIPQALLFFNLGVEIGQLIFVGVVISLTIVLLRLIPIIGFTVLRLPSLKLSAAYGIGMIAMYWTIERTALIF